jgi:hypothetical protein
MAPGPLFPRVVAVNSFAALMVSRSGPCMNRAPLPNIIPTVAIGAFTHSVQTHSNAVKFAHQSLGSPKISSLLKATQRLSQHHREPNHQVAQSKPRQSQGTHETTTTWDQEHAPETVLPSYARHARFTPNAAVLHERA